MARLNVNGKVHHHNAEPDTPLLWVLREQLGMTGTKYGCGIAQCGSCTVHLDGQPVRSCVLPVSAVQPTQKITTSKACRQTFQAVPKAPRATTRCKKPGSSWTCRNAATARAAC